VAPISELRHHGDLHRVELAHRADAVALPERLDVLARRGDDPGGFVPEDLAGLRLRADPLPVALLGVPVAPTDAAGFRLHDDLVGVRFGTLDVSDGKRFSVLFEEGSFHTSHDTNHHEKIRHRDGSANSAVL
jgi:hypothetical protein